ncbi:MAG: hypothetical protein KF802_15935 [Bdellovibrionaceae bacterium]|nr:hypothetical protein [Pseudobdellovibrionaceae bacterium]MBX3035058.1 hypothetical protein [Pseudobdellovibrionaceae bacterium]
MKSMIFAALMLSGLAAQAHSGQPACRAGAWTNVAHLSCASAQHLIASTGYYFRCTGDGPIPISVSQNTNCGVRYFLAPLPVRTADNKQCVVGFYCRSGH